MTRTHAFRTRKIHLAPVLAILAATGAARASEQVGTLTQLEGPVKIFHHPSKTLQKNGGTHALFEGEYYLVEDAKPGDKVEQGNIVRTAPGAKVRVIFDNGDQYNVGPASAYRVHWDKDAANAHDKIDLMYGKLRGVVAKGGPRSKLIIRTKTATMGVRGTDFFIADDGKDGATEVSILRGAVEVKPVAPAGKPAETIEVKAGYSASVAPVAAPQPEAKEEAAKPAAPVAEAPKVELRRTTQEELDGIQKSSQVHALKKEDLAAMPKPVAEKIEKLQTKAVETAILDVKASDPKLYAQLEENKPQSPDQINSASVMNLLKDAPKAPEHHKPYKSEIENLDNGAYDRYFKIVE